MESWNGLLDVLILITSALLLGMVAEQLRQSAILGYLLAGMLVGPNVLGAISNTEELAVVAELGAALLLFTIGLEFSFRRLIRSGRAILLGGSLQIIVTGGLASGLALLMGMTPRAAIALGAVVSLSSTAFVSRILIDRSQMDSLIGRSAIGILLLQDLAIVPLVLLVSSLSGSVSALGVLASVGQALVLGALGFAALYAVFNYVVPRLFVLRGLAKNRELPILLAVVLVVGSTYAAHSIDVSPAVGAFAAGLLLAESPFAVQVRSDIASLRTLLTTLFFAVVGMFGDPGWALGHAGEVALVTLLVVLGKSFVVAGVLRLLRFPAGLGLMTGLVLAQVGEFSFVLAQTALAGDIFDADLFQLVISTSVVTLLLTPFLVGLAFRLLERGVVTLGNARHPVPPEDKQRNHRPDAIVVGFGPAGQEAAADLLGNGFEVVVVDANPKNGDRAADLGVAFQVGDASQAEVMEHLGVRHASVAVLALPDPVVTLRIIDLIRFLSPDTKVVARARYHMLKRSLAQAGAHVVIDEEEQVGRMLAEAACSSLRDTVAARDSLAEGSEGADENLDDDGARRTGCAAGAGTPRP